MNYDDFSVLIPLRGGSKSIPRKNIKIMAGKPLCFWAIESALELGAKIYVSTEDVQIRLLIEESYPRVLFINRPLELAQDDTSTEAVIRHSLSFVETENVILIQATSPLTGSRHLREAIRLYCDNDQKPLITCVRQHQFIWGEDGMPVNYSPFRRPRRQEWGGCLVESGSFYIFRRESFLESLCRCAPPVTIYELPAAHAIEIDEPLDWSVMELVMLDNRVS